MKWRDEIREFGERNLAITTTIYLAIILLTILFTGCGYEPLDANGEYYRPWREDPYSATGADWFDRHIYTAEEAEAKTEWKRLNPPTDWVDAARR